MIKKNGGEHHLSPVPTKRIFLYAPSTLININKQNNNQKTYLPDFSDFNILTKPITAVAASAIS